MGRLRLKWLTPHTISTTGLLIIGSLVCAVAANAQSAFNKPGNILITDQFNNRVIEIDPAGNIVWHFGIGPGDISATSIIGTNDAERVGGFTLMSGTGIPNPPACSSSNPFCPSGCADNRVILVDVSGRIVWQYGEFGVTGSGPNELNTPVQNTFLPKSRTVLITDQGNERIIEVRLKDKAIVWQYGTTGVIGNGPDQLSNPNAAELLANGNILISDENNNRAIEVTHTTPSTIVATFTTAGTTACGNAPGFSGVAFASRLPNGHTLITDSNNSRIVETDLDGTVFWEFCTNARSGSSSSPLPTRAVRLENGNTLISDQCNHQVIAVNPAGDIVASYGTINSPGFSPNNASVMNGPYSAYDIHDYTGMTPPF